MTRVDGWPARGSPEKASRRELAPASRGGSERSEAKHNAAGRHARMGRGEARNVVSNVYLGLLVVGNKNDATNGRQCHRADVDAGKHILKDGCHQLPRRVLEVKPIEDQQWCGSKLFADGLRPRLRAHNIPHQGVLLDAERQCWPARQPDQPHVQADRCASEDEDAARWNE